MKKICKHTVYLLPACLLLFSCAANNTETDDPNPTENDSSDQDQSPKVTNALYGSVDSTFQIDTETFTVHVDQFDLTEQVYAQGDTLPRPTYFCRMEIFSATGSLLFQDSLTRNSWGYPGKIESIDAYQIALPELSYGNNEIIASYRIYESNSLDAIIGSVAFNITSHDTRMYWEETYPE